jgi:hypothetical protein
MGQVSGEILMAEPSMMLDREFDVSLFDRPTRTPPTTGDSNLSQQQR